MSSVSEARSKILDGSYPSNVVAGRQRKHIEGTKEFEQKRAQMHRESPGSEPAILDADAQSLVEEYKGKGDIYVLKGSEYPRELIDTDETVGKTWVKSLQKYVVTKSFTIIYSSSGVHVVPLNTFKNPFGR